LVILKKMAPCEKANSLTRVSGLTANVQKVREIKIWCKLRKKKAPALDGFDPTGQETPFPIFIRFKKPHQTAIVVLLVPFVVSLV